MMNSQIESPLLGLATTRELLEEITVRMEVTQNSIKGRELGRLCREAIERLATGVLNYRTVGRYMSDESDEDALLTPVTELETAQDRPREEKPELSERSTGEDVRTLQEALNDHMESNLRIDGNFGPVTLREVRLLQQDRRLTVDGIVGPETWEALGH